MGGNFRLISDTAANPVGTGQPLITIAVTTNNRSQKAAELITALRPQLDPERNELLIIDSGSNAQHAQTLIETAQIPGSNSARVRLVRLDVSGSSRARNLALACASGKWVAFIHDDALISDDWVQALFHAVNNVPENCAVIGGPVVPEFDGDTSHLTDAWRILIYPYPAREGDCTQNPMITGANLMVRRDAAIAVGGHDMTLGRHGDLLMSGDERIMVNRMIANGWRLWVFAEMAIRRIIPSDRLTLKWAKQRMFWEGVTERREAHLMGTSPGLGQNLWFSLKLAGHLFMCLMPIEATKHHLSLAWHEGYIHEWLFPAKIPPA
jgi:glycosyltransferase involved in cell wall biosynthesis